MITWERFKKTKAASIAIVVPKFNEAAEDYNCEDLRKEGKKIANCGTMIKTLQCARCGENYFKSYARCKSKYCPTCSALKGAIWCAKLYPRLKEWLDRGNNIHFATFTIPDQEDINEALNIINNSWRYMTNKLVTAEWKKRFAGGVKAVECKIGRYSGKWHVHIHCLVLRTGYRKDTYFLREAWTKAVKHYIGKDKQVLYPNIKPIRAKDNSKDKDKILEAVCETVKYATKINPEMENYRIKQAFEALKNRRQIACWGILRGISKEVEKEINEESENIIEAFKCATCGHDICEFIELWENSGKHWQDTELKNYKESVIFKEKELKLNLDQDWGISEEDGAYAQLKW